MTDRARSRSGGVPESKTADQAPASARSHPSSRWRSSDFAARSAPHESPFVEVAGHLDRLGPRGQPLPGLLGPGRIEVQPCLAKDVGILGVGSLQLAVIDPSAKPSARSSTRSIYPRACSGAMLKKDALCKEYGASRGQANAKTRDVITCPGRPTTKKELGGFAVSNLVYEGVIVSLSLFDLKDAAAFLVRRTEERVGHPAFHRHELRRHIPRSSAVGQPVTWANDDANLARFQTRNDLCTKPVNTLILLHACVREERRRNRIRLSGILHCSWTQVAPLACSFLVAGH
jgi:hypothetical protein